MLVVSVVAERVVAGRARQGKNREEAGILMRKSSIN
jgi:hypothetical protein